MSKRDEWCLIIIEQDVIYCVCKRPHSSEDNEEVWRNEWGGRAFFAHGTHQSRGVAVFINRTLSCKIDVIHQSSEGRSILIRICYNDVVICVNNIYAPNKDSPFFFHTEILRLFNICDKVILIGDYNTVLNNELDRKLNNSSAVPVDSKSSKQIHELMDELSLEDIWRIRNPSIKRYSWYRKTKRNNKSIIQASRLDFALISSGLSSSVHNCLYLNGVQTDHSAFFLGLELFQTDRGKGFWKFNSTILSDITYIQMMNEELCKMEKKYSYLNPADKWELMKKDIRAVTKKYTKNSASESQLVISQLSEKVVEYENKLDTLNNEEIRELDNTKIELEEKLVHKTNGVIFRSKAKWFMEGERNTKYFYNLERNRYNTKTCTSIFNPSGQLIENPAEILELQQNFYQELYTSDETVSFNLCFEIENRVTNHMIASAEHQFSIEEFSNSLKGMRNGSCPGSDGLSTEFYKVFWRYLKQSVYDAMIYSYNRGYLNESSRQGILNLIPKGQKDTRYLKNLRPITLLNTDYKMVERAVANRMIPALEEIIHEDQKGFLPNRRIVANIRKILDITVEAINENVDGFILSCDYLKCFDRIEKSAVLGAMRQFQFSHMLTQWVETLYENFKVRVQNNGNFSEEIDIQRSVRQGGPASNALFLVVAELLAIMLRNDQQIEGITLKSILHLLNQYADDMDVCSKYKQSSLDAILSNIRLFHDHTGFALSYEKTVLYRVGSLAKSKAELYTAEGIKWTSEKLNILGVDVTDETSLLKINYDPLIDKANSICNQWMRRNLSLMGRINVLNTLVASLFVYKMSVLPMMKKDWIEKLDNIMAKFLWSGHKPKIPLSVLKLSKTNGGCGLVDFNRKEMSIKCAWVQMLTKQMYPSGMVYRIIEADLQNMIWCVNLSPRDVSLVVKTNNTFWVDVFVSWCSYHYTEKCSGSVQIIWWNSHIRVNNKPIFWRKQHKAGLMYVHDLIEDGAYISGSAAYKKYGLDAMHFNMLKSAIPLSFADFAKKYPEVHFTDPKYQRYMATDKCVRHVYLELENDTVYFDKIQTKWTDELQLWDTDIVEEICKIKHTTKVPKLQSFQYRLLNRAIITNIHLKRWRISETDLCTFCETEPETYAHVFYECSHVKPIIEEMMNLCAEHSSSEISLSYSDIILNSISGLSSDVSNFICLCAKQYIYSKKCLKQPLCTREFRSKVYMCKNSEKYYAVMQNSTIKYLKRWEPQNINLVEPDIIEQIEGQKNTRIETSSINNIHDVMRC